MKKTFLFNDKVMERMNEYGAQLILGPLVPKSALYVPLINGNDVRGVISLQNMDHENSFKASDVRLLETLAGSLSAALENAHLFDETQRLLQETEQRAAELEAIRKATINLSTSLDYTTVLDSLLQNTSALMPSIENINLFIYENNELKFGTAIAHGQITYAPVSKPRRGGATETVSRTGEVLLVEDMSTHPLYQNAPTSWKGALIGLPLKFGNKVVGVMNIHFAEAQELAASWQQWAEQNRVLHRTIKSVTEDIRQMAFNTAIAKMMEFTNYFFKAEPEAITRIQSRLKLNGHVHVQHFQRVA